MAQLAAAQCSYTHTVKTLRQLMMHVGNNVHLATCVLHGMQCVHAMAWRKVQRSLN